MTKQDFISQIAYYVKKYAPDYGVKVYSPIIAQACLESAYGTSELAEKANNFFGLKYSAEVSTKGIYVKIGSEQNPDGSYTSSVMKWCNFTDMEDGVKGYFNFLFKRKNVTRYNGLIGITDPKTYLDTIKAAGYATSLKYVDNLMNVIKNNNLTQYDTDKKEDRPMIKIAIDAGHGSNTAGKRTPDGYREHWANVMTANYFAMAIERCGFTYIKVAWNDTNAKDDTDIPLADRQAMIKAAGCQASVSWHFNACGDGKTYNTGEGIETLISNKYPGDSLKLAQAVQAELIKGTAQKNRGVKTQSLAMCNCKALGTQASILIECGFMTNLREAELMKSEAFCRECAEEAAKGLCNYFKVPYVAPGSSIVTNIINNTVPAAPAPAQTKPVTSAEYKVRVTANSLNIRKGPGTTNAIVGTITDKGVYTIVEETNGWGKLKSGKGWISLKYTTKI